MTLYFDISPLQESNYTGIPAVTENIATRLLEDTTLKTVFFWERFVIPSTVLRLLLNIRDGRYFLEAMRAGRHNLKIIDSEIKFSDVVFFSNVGFEDRLTEHQVQFVHDLTTILVPETHHRDTIEWHRRDFARAQHNVDLFLANSQCTADDMHLYLGIDKSKIEVCRLGVSKPSFQDLPTITEKYICVIGTLEPRKNLSIVFRLLESFPEWLTEYKFVFIGRFGWGKSLEDTFQGFPIILQALFQGRIIFTGYVSESMKWALLSSAAASIYASLYEGFGLPVLESICCGTPCIASYSSSLTEAGGDFAEYFDPLDHRSLHLSLKRTMKPSFDVLGRRELLKSYAAKLTWDLFYDQLRSALSRWFADGIT